jgi:amidase
MNASLPFSGRKDSTVLATIASVPKGGRLADIRIGIKDLFDIEGFITTAGSAAVESVAIPATKDAACLAGIRDAEADGLVRIVAKLNLHELAYGGDGINPHFGTPPNPLDAARVPGGSSSGSASAVGTGRVEIALGSDTGGSIRIPAACCGVVGMKTTWGRIPLEGVWPLAPSLDTAGPMAARMDNMILGMDLLEPGFAVEVSRTPAATVVGRLRNTGVNTHPALDEAVDRALADAGFDIVEIDADWWEQAIADGLTALVGEAYRTLNWMLDDSRLDPLLEKRISNRIAGGARISDEALEQSLAQRDVICAHIDAACRVAQVLISPTLPMLAPLMTASAVFAPYTAYTRPANLAGTPALALPVPLDPSLVSISERHLKGSIQLMGPRNAEALLASTGSLIEQAVTR